MLTAVNKGLFATRVSTPKDENNVLFLLGYKLNNAVGKPRPTAFGMGVRLVRANGQRSVH